MARTLPEMVATARSEAREISPAEAAAETPRPISPSTSAGEFQAGHLPRSMNIPRGMIELPADPASPGASTAIVAATSARILLYCTKSPSARSLLAAQTLQSMAVTTSRCSTAGSSPGPKPGFQWKPPSRDPPDPGLDLLR